MNFAFRLSMKLQRSLILSLGGVLVVACVGRLLLSAESPPTPEELRQIRKTPERRQFQRRLRRIPQARPEQRRRPAKGRRRSCGGYPLLANAGAGDEVDGFRQQVIDLHQANWRLLWAAAETYLYGEHYGFLIAGKFYRGNRHGGGPFVYTVVRDRIEALQLMQRAMPLLKTESDAPAKADFYLSFAKMLLTDGNDDTTYRWHGRYCGGIWEPSAVNYGNAWRLQVLTNLKELPEYEPGWNYGGQTRGPRSTPTTGRFSTRLPKRWEDAANDGQRGAGHWPRLWKCRLPRKTRPNWNWPTFSTASSASRPWPSTDSSEAARRSTESRKRPARSPSKR